MRGGELTMLLAIVMRFFVNLNTPQKLRSKVIDFFSSSTMHIPCLCRRMHLTLNRSPSWVLLNVVNWLFMNPESKINCLLVCDSQNLRSSIAIIQMNCSTESTNFYQCTAQRLMF